jgi:hypothetical protein
MQPRRRSRRASRARKASRSPAPPSAACPAARAPARVTPCARAARGCTRAAGGGRHILQSQPGGEREEAGPSGAHAALVPELLQHPLARTRVALAGMPAPAGARGHAVERTVEVRVQPVHAQLPAPRPSARGKGGGGSLSCAFQGGVFLNSLSLLHSLGVS